ncbi:type IV toxin-antitoxin system AbiEi family antitoxin domain-containing protein [Lewinella sp. LCG006]|uniref:type IV toxin-antitoxin system AbiEi family antitoxin domain-containing protein n=1 Tax=Lewinella sp. LCG006 TaxID=3231911 RepID=UPI003460A2CF
MNVSLIQNWFKENHGVMTSKELIELGVTYYSIRHLLAEGIISKIKRGVYLLNDTSEDENGLIVKLLPKGVYCLQSAASIYNYTTSVPLRYHIAVHNKANHNLPDHPPIKLYYWKDSQYELGIEEKEINGVNIKIYDREKTVCDYFKFRNKLEFTSVKEVLNSYLRDTNRDIVRLKKYSRVLKIDKVLDHYLEVLI